MVPGTPMENNSTIVASTQELSNALKMSTNATKVWVADRMCNTSVREPAIMSATRLAVVQLRRDVRSNSGMDHMLQHLKQHDAKEIGR